MGRELQGDRRESRGGGIIFILCLSVKSLKVRIILRSYKDSGVYLIIYLIVKYRK